MKKSPQFIYSTRMGSIYHLTPFHQPQLNIDACLLSAGDFFHIEKTLKKMQAETQISFKKYINQEDKTLYFTSIDSYKMKCVEGTQNQNGVKIVQLEGLKLTTNQQYNSLARTINPEYMVSLTEQPDMAAGYKSLKRSITKSAKFLRETLEELKDTEVCVYGAIQGGLEVDLRTLAAEEQKFAIDFPNFKGFTLYGFNQGGCWQEKEDALAAIYSVYCGHDLEFILAGKGDILSILWGISWGIDGFEVEEPFSLAQDLKTLLLPEFEAKEKELEQFSGDRINFFEFENKKIKSLSFPINSNIAENIPLNKDCECFSCKNHTKLYISHLVECKEMNAQVLLTIHNTYQYQQLQQKLQEMKGKNLLNQWIRWYLSKL